MYKGILPMHFKTQTNCVSYKMHYKGSKWVIGLNEPFNTLQRKDCIWYDGVVHAWLPTYMVQHSSGEALLKRKRNKPMNSWLCVRYKVFFLRSKIFIVFVSKKENDKASIFLWQSTKWNLIHFCHRKTAPLHPSTGYSHANHCPYFLSSLQQ